MIHQKFVRSDPKVHEHLIYYKLFHYKTERKFHKIRNVILYYSIDYILYGITHLIDSLRKTNSLFPILTFIF